MEQLVKASREYKKSLCPISQSELLFKFELIRESLVENLFLYTTTGDRAVIMSLLTIRDAEGKIVAHGVGRQTIAESSIESLVRPSCSKEHISGVYILLNKRRKLNGKIFTLRCFVEGY